MSHATRTRYILFLAPFGQLTAANQRAGDLAEYQAAGIATFDADRYVQTIAGPQKKYPYMGHYVTDAQYTGWQQLADDLGGYVETLKTWDGSGWQTVQTMDEALAALDMERPAEEPL